MKNQAMKKFFETLHIIQMKNLQLENNQNPFTILEKNGLKLIVCNN